ncbi:type I polyketide synthase [Novipirellula artificiosorum]|uniref:Phthiocerol/phenolphthiocerol synthesis polyketide synthase type I PpsA n=1 Tax=Novipirellula artificiosorum TaxID=2528016 RepID=A0A5C6D9T4_9BACT|nr:type I polyketide synthase [Novipirellula artificiosorum]TWU31996.1 Phthiocerol/phenolphthiocerol synthesis polyketide synthase type I PpsA [Novipirellula artificiosorum]
MTERNPPSSDEPLALVGVGCRFPGGACDANSLWQLLVDGHSAIRDVPDDRWHVDRYHHRDADTLGHMVTRRGGFVDQLKQFDAAFWGISPREAMRMDPQQRWLLETAWEACEDAGIPPSKLRGTSMGVFVGASSHDYGSLQMNDIANLDVHTNTGGTLSIAANRISYLFDLKGPSIAVDTACSSALVAVALACRSIWAGQCGAALAGGVNALITPNTSIGFSKASMLSPSGECFAFDARADGYVRGEGAGLVLLKPLSEAIKQNDRIYAVLRSAVVNQDGQTSSMTVPSVDGQCDMLRTAYREAGVDPRDVAYVEAHGTGTPVGDPIEAEALGRVLSEGRDVDDVCWMGSIKTNIGHLESASGIAGLIKAALVLEHKQIPANRNFDTPNAAIPLQRYQLKVPTQLRSLPTTEGQQPVAAVNSFGFGGTNAHVVMQAAPDRAPLRRDGTNAERPFILSISARDEASLREYAKRYRQRLKTIDHDLADFCYSAATRKERHELRLAVMGNDARQLRQRLTQWLNSGEASEGIVASRSMHRSNENVFVFTGQGSQWAGMGQRLLQSEPIVRDTLAEIDEHFQALSGWSLVREMARPASESNIQQTRVAQPAIFALQIALVRLWASWGIRPTLVVGHSVGEVAAALCAGIYSLRDAVSLVYHRSRLQNNTGGAGRMVAAGVSAAEAREFIGTHADRVQITAENSPALVTMGGDTELVDLIGARIESSGRFVRWLGLDYAFHTHQMDPIKDALLEALASLKPQPERIPFVSTVTGQCHPGDQMDAGYWWRNVREPVQFETAMATIAAKGAQRYLELGPHPALRSSIDACLADRKVEATIVHSLTRETDDQLELATNVAKLDGSGADIDWHSVNQGSGAYVPQPHYPWNYQAYWLDQGETGNRVDPPLHPLLGERLNVATPTWQFHLDPHLFPYLNDHQIWDGIVFPAAGYAEIGIAIAAALFPDDSYAVEDIECENALFVSANAVPKIQVVFDSESKSYSVYSASSTANGGSVSGSRASWEIHARGRLVMIPMASESQVIDLCELRQRLPRRITHDDLYRDLFGMGYGFGADFSLIQESWSDVAGSELGSLYPEALSRISVPKQVAEDSIHYGIHPAVLDACFQATHGTRDVAELADHANCLYLPQAIGRVQLHTKQIPTELWAHAKQSHREGSSVEYSICVVDESGKPVASISRFRVTKVDQPRRSARAEEQFYQFKWQPKRLRGARVGGSANFASIDEVLAAVEDSIPQGYATRGLSEYYNDFIPRMEQIVHQLIENAFVELGWSFGVGECFTYDQVFESFGIAEQHHRLFRAELGWLTVNGAVQANDSGWQVKRGLQRIDMAPALAELAKAYPRFASEVSLVEATGPRLAEALAGELDPLDLLFPDGSNELMEAFYTHASDLPAFNQLIQTAVAKSIERLPERRVLRVLEIGAGTGSLTRSLLEVLPPDRLEYTFTDVGRAFITEAKRSFADHPSIHFQSFDIERDPTSQGIVQNGYDLIVATNVLHATADLRSTLAHVQTCLASEGRLVFLELVRHRPICDNVFGLLEGWWKFTDTDERDHSPLLNRVQWESLLSRSGFDQIQSFTCSPNEQEAEQTVFVTVGPAIKAIESPTDANSKRPSTVLVYADRGGMGQAIASKFEQQGNRVIVLRRDASFERINESAFTLADGNATELERVFADSKLDDTDLKTIVHCWALDHTAAPSCNEQLLADQRTGVFSALQLSQALEKIDPAASPRVYFLTRSAQAVADNDPIDGLAASPLIGFCRVASNETSQFRWTLVDLDPNPGPFEADDVFNEITDENEEQEVALRDDQRFVHRLQRISFDQIPLRSQCAVLDSGAMVPFKLQMRKAGVLENLTLNETNRRPPGPDEIAVRVFAGGINFRDVMKALGMHPGTSEDLLWFGDDFSGVVEAVGSRVNKIKCGDCVSGIAPYAFRSHVTVDQRLVFKHPTSLSFEQAATLPTVFLTTHFAIKKIARMQRGERILIHAAAGGVGQAAIQVAHHLGLEVFATAGTTEKRELLKSMGVAHVMNSRTVEFADQIWDQTSGAGVDAVLNSLAGEFIPKSLSVLAPFGKFLEIGKVDVYGNSKLGLAAFKNNISYHMIDLAQLLVQRPDQIAALLAELSLLFESGTYAPLPHTVFPVHEAAEAFRFMAQGNHIGKNVLAFPRDPAEASTLCLGPCTDDGSLLRGDASYLITGGANGFGFEIAKWMVRQGARHLVLMSRSGPREEAAKEIAALRSEAVTIMDARGDVTNPEDVDRVIEQIQPTCPALKGVVHAAMVLDDAFLADLDEERFASVLYPKMLGAWNLHQSTRNLSLDHFICFSSFSTIVGAPKQASYNAGNSFLDALAKYRHAKGLPALTLNWGAVLGAGFVARNEKTAEYLDGIGLIALQMQEALKVFAEMILRDTPLLGVGRVDWQQLSQLCTAVAKRPMYEGVAHDSSPDRSNASLQSELCSASRKKRPEILENFLAQQVAAVFGIDAGKVDRDASLNQIGVDSLMAVELINRMESATGARIPMSRILSGSTVRELSQSILELIPGLDHAEPMDSNNLRTEGDAFASDAINFELEAELDPTIVPSKTLVHRDSPPRLLLTGATGFLGAHLLHELLETTPSQVVCLVRSDNEQAGKRRIVNNLSKYGLQPREIQDRVKVISSDFSRPQLGLTPEQFDQLADSVDVIYHNGANVNLVMPYQSLRQDNVEGTRELLRLACHRVQKPLHYVSTFTVHATEANRGCRIQESEPLPVCEDLLYGYSQTKWVAERMIEEARRRGMSVTIYRPGHVTGHSTTGVANVDDLLHQIVRACLLIGAAPFRDFELDVTPVDFVSKAMVYLAQQKEAQGKTFHLTNPNPLSAKALSDWMRDGGANIELMDVEPWRERLIELADPASASTDGFKVLGDLLVPRLAAGGNRAIHGRFCCRQTLDALIPSGVKCAPADARLISTCHTYIQQMDRLLRIDDASDSQLRARCVSDLIQPSDEQVH